MRITSEAPSNPRPVSRKLLPFDPREEKTITRTWDQPVLSRERLGSIPQDYYEHAWSYPVPGWGWWTSSSRHYSCGGGSCEMGPVGVYRDVPVYDSGNNPRKESVTKTLTEKTYDQKKSFFTSLGLGLAAGAGAGVGILAAMAPLTGTGGALAGVAGGLLGAAAGGFIGYKAVDDDKIEEVWMQDDISHPTMTGYTEEIDPDVWHESRCHTEHDSNGNDRQVCETWSTLRGYDHDFYPSISWRKVGDYTYPTLQHTAKASPVWAGVGAAVAGLGLGAAAAAAVHFLL